tara:strand:+ start:162 stop:587 length:426 start_codon:yes stop_codon:yes gene_type:complete
MLKIAKLTDYAVVILSFMAEREQKATAGFIAEKVRLSLPTVAKIMKQLAAAGLIGSIRGVGGGYKLERSADDIKLIEVIEAMEGPVALTACVEGVEHECALLQHCPASGRWDMVNNAIRQALGDVTLADMICGRTIEKMRA